MIDAWVIAWPQPSTGTGCFAMSRARSVRVITMAPPPSVIRQQSRTVNGSLTGRAFSTSAMVRGFFSHATGLSNAHSRAATATSAICSRVVPNSNMWREAAIA